MKPGETIFDVQKRFTHCQPPNRSGQSIW